MIETLDKIITDEHLGWNKTLTDQKQQFVVQLDSKIIEDLIKRRNELDKLNEIDTPMDLERAKYTALLGRFFEKN